MTTRRQQPHLEAEAEVELDQIAVKPADAPTVTSDVEAQPTQAPEPVLPEASEQQAAWDAGKPVYVNPGPPTGEG
jgi:hypothetical protein